MYKVVVKDHGKYGNVAAGSRYCLTKRSMTKLTNTFKRFECDFQVFKFTHIHGDIFMWAPIM